MVNSLSWTHTLIRDLAINRRGTIMSLWDKYFFFSLSLIWRSLIFYFLKIWPHLRTLDWGGKKSASCFECFIIGSTPAGELLLSSCGERKIRFVDKWADSISSVRLVLLVGLSFFPMRLLDVLQICVVHTIRCGRCITGWKFSLSLQKQERERCHSFFLLPNTPHGSDTTQVGFFFFSNGKNLNEKDTDNNSTTTQKGKKR